MKLCDFGFSYYRRWEGNECLGTVEYMAPEVVAGEEYGEKVDVWGVGVVIYEMATGQMVVPQKDNRYVFLNNVRLTGYCSLRMIGWITPRSRIWKLGGLFRNACRETLHADPAPSIY